jgi:hypothetical protein
VRVKHHDHLWSLGIGCRNERADEQKEQQGKCRYAHREASIREILGSAGDFHSVFSGKAIPAEHMESSNAVRTCSRHDRTFCK